MATVKIKTFNRNNKHHLPHVFNSIINYVNLNVNVVLNYTTISIFKTNMRNSKRIYCIDVNSQQVCDC